MPLSEGDRLGPYQIGGLLGAGGMGEVYKATDTRLNRTVAIKVLPADLASDLERRQRFEREARLVASLNHPHICAVHDVGSQSISGGEPVSYLVMEYLEGETLAERLARGPLPLAETMRLGAAIAVALAAAHREQIVHRDLKPANVMLTKSGLKLLDFGIAKAVQPVAQAGGTLMSTKALTAATMPGTTVGTLPYMSPEQLEGRPVDARSDIFALGAVLFEMATGTRAFRGDSYAAVASSILASSPPPITTSPALDRIVRSCLEKDPDRRWQSAHDVALNLAAAGEREATAETPRPRRALQWLPWAIAFTAIALAATVWLAGWRARPATTGTPAFRTVVKFQIAPPGGPNGFLHSVEHPAMAVSPDGSHLAFSTITRSGDTRLWVRALSSLDARPVDGSDGAGSMFWSPDGRSIAFFAGGKLKRVELAGGGPVPICAVRERIGLAGTWSADGTILFATSDGEAIMKVAASGGTAIELLKPDPQRGEKRTTWPTFLPDGRSFLYLATLSDGSGAVMFARPGAHPIELVRAKSYAQYVDPGYVLFVEDSTLVARRFDPATGQVSGDLIAVADPVMYFRTTGNAEFSTSRNGVIAYQSHVNQSRIAWFDRSGTELGTVRPAATYQTVRLSPDGTRVLFERTNPRTTTWDIYLLELDRAAETQLTTDPETESFPLWGPAETLIYSASRGSPPRLHRRPLQSGPEEPIGPDVPGHQQPTDVSPDGQWVLYAQRTSRGDRDLHALQLSDGKSMTLRDSTFDETDGRFSPDGRFVSFTSYEGGRPEVYVMPFLSAGSRRAVSSGGGALARWSRDGRVLFYLSLTTDTAHLTSASMRFTPSLEIGKATPLFPFPPGRRWTDFALAPDGRFLAVQTAQFAGQLPVTVIANWPASLAR